ncbi:hypothetical protein B0H11DRAFT_2199362 [Mycena galericulata]|nr:hypothetical protein B0H11DRAFT_2199362 [Mycena galericulata]
MHVAHHAVYQCRLTVLHQDLCLGYVRKLCAACGVCFFLRAFPVSIMGSSRRLRLSQQRRVPNLTGPWKCLYKFSNPPDIDSARQRVHTLSSTGVLVVDIINWKAGQMFEKFSKLTFGHAVQGLGWANRVVLRVPGPAYHHSDGGCERDLCRSCRRR